MLVRPRQIKIGTDAFDGFDLLERKESAHRLTELVDRVEDPLVIALDGGWGTGKSWFLKLWPGEHRKKGGAARLIYFDAFAHDFLDAPLASLTQRLETEVSGQRGTAAKAMKTVTNAAKRIAIPAVRIGTAIATLAVSEAAAGAANAVMAELEPLVGSLWQSEKSRIEAMGHFRKGLADLACETPLVFIVDELDRCRPDYALATLEVIKHFFDVPKVHFVLGANFTALRSSVSARYGSEINAGLYLQKFVNLTMTLPEPKDAPSPVKYLNLLIERLRAEGHPLATRLRLIDELSQIAAMPKIAARLNLRAIERVLDRIALFPGDLDKAPWPEQMLAVFAAILEASDRSLFEAFLAGTADQETIGKLCTEQRPYDSAKRSQKSLTLQSICLEVLGGMASADDRQSLTHIYRMEVDDNGFGSYLRGRLAAAFAAFSLPPKLAGVEG